MHHSFHSSLFFTEKVLAYWLSSTDH
jgi:hypothetical protein